MEGSAMRETKAQLRAEAVERLEDTRMDSGNAVKKLAAAIGSEWNPPSVNYSLGCLKAKLIYLLTDEPETVGNGDSYDLDTDSDAVNGKKCDSLPDSREKLEADIYRAADEMETFMCGSGFINTRMIIEWIDRQAAITERECLELGAAVQNQRDKRIAELQEQVDELETELDVANSKKRSLRLHIQKMQSGRNGWHIKAKKLEAENEQLREKLSRAYDNAHDTLRMMD